MFLLLAKSSAKLLSPLWQSLKSINFEVSSKGTTLAFLYALDNLKLYDMHEFCINIQKNEEYP